jgi:hypothetical protein
MYVDGSGTAGRGDAAAGILTDTEPPGRELHPGSEIRNPMQSTEIDLFTI